VKEKRRIKVSTFLIRFVNNLDFLFRANTLFLEASCIPEGRKENRIPCRDAGFAKDYSGHIANENSGQKETKHNTHHFFAAFEIKPGAVAHARLVHAALPRLTQRFILVEFPFPAILFAVFQESNALVVLRGSVKKWRRGGHHSEDKNGEDKMQSHDLRFYIRKQKNAFKVYKLLKYRKRRMTEASASLFYLSDIFISSLKCS
tara:strand:+ start:6123 stop:6731 length:609 start_codon:yes stop_codon:yes gene_type:complete